MLEPFTQRTALGEFSTKIHQDYVAKTILHLPGGGSFVVGSRTVPVGAYQREAEARVAEWQADVQIHYAQSLGQFVDENYSGDWQQAYEDWQAQR